VTGKGRGMESTATEIRRLNAHLYETFTCFRRISRVFPHQRVTIILSNKA
jgi:hypothetical protein